MIRGAIAAALGRAALLGLGSDTALAAPPQNIVAQDLAARSPQIHWPAEFAPPGADMFSHNEIVVPAACSRV
jgi:hypothetical protein